MSPSAVTLAPSGEQGGRGLVPTPPCSPPAMGRVTERSAAPFTADLLPIHRLTGYLWERVARKMRYGETPSLAGALSQHVSERL